MFLRKNTPVGSFAGKTSYFDKLNVENLNHISTRRIRKYDRNLNNAVAWTSHKSYVLWQWVNQNFAISESFINHLLRNIRKIGLVLNAKEEHFINNLQELYFTTWRPLKEIIVRFETKKKEIVYFFQSKVNIHLFDEQATSGKRVHFVVSGPLYFSNEAIYVCDDEQEIKQKFSFNKISEVRFHDIGVIIVYDGTTYLFRAKNNYLTYVILQRMLPKLHLNINKITTLYNYFDFWNKLESKVW